MTRYMGLDIGSGTSKGVILQEGQLVVFNIVPSGVNYKQAIEKVKSGLLDQSGLTLKDICAIGATGHSAAGLGIAECHFVDIRCCARGINYLFPDVRTVVDIQGQSSQAIRLSQTGKVVDFASNEKCASGSGRFLDVIANVLQVELKDIGQIAQKSHNPVVFTTGCAVFGESEAVSRVAEGRPVEDILAGVIQALADRIAALIDRVGLEAKCAVSGGGALNSGLVAGIGEKLGTELLVPPQPQIVNAIGAAVLIAEQA